MKTTIYELLGMIKDNKAPKRIVYKNNCYEWFDDEKDYITETHWLFDEYVITDILNDEVEILETTITYKQEDIENAMKSVKWVKEKLFPIIDEINKIEKKDDKIEKLQYYDNSIMWCMNGREITDNEKDIIDKINEIIDYLNK